MNKISAEHLCRDAIVYIRESTSYQVANNLESQRRQYALEDNDKVFSKSEGFYDGKTKEGQMQLLYSGLISYYFDAQFGVRQDFSAKSNRTYATLGVEGLASFFIEIDAHLFISQKGEVSSEITAFHDLLITNRLILQPRIDLKLQAQRVPDLNLGSGFTDVELGARLRYEITRNIAPTSVSSAQARRNRQHCEDQWRGGRQPVCRGRRSRAVVKPAPAAHCESDLLARFSASSRNANDAQIATTVIVIELRPPARCKHAASLDLAYSSSVFRLSLTCDAAGI